jgi:hypothetical protein
MDAHEIARRASVLPARFASRIPVQTLEGLRLMEEGGEFGELTADLAATLVKARAIVTVEEQTELRELLAATDMPTSSADELEVQG